MKYDQLRDYFDTYITNYKPYKDNLIYQQLTAFLLDYYFDHSYNEIPLEFRSLYETQVITVELYDYILTSNGFPEDIVNNMQLRDKAILISTFMDFNKYKGSVEIIRRVANAYSEQFNIYELFIDYRNDKWIFVPYLVYKCPQLNIPEITTEFDFDTIVASTKLFFITKEYLDGLRENSQIIFPIKSNLIFLDYVESQNDSQLIRLLATIVFNHYKNERLKLYFEDGVYQISLENAYKLWYYVIFKAYKNLSIDNFPGSYMFFDIMKPNFPFNISDIETIKSEYAKVNNRRSLTKFYNTYLSVFDDIQIDIGKYTAEKICALYENILDPSLVEYVNFRLAENTLNRPEKMLINADYILDQIYNSLITWEYDIYESPSTFEYIGYFLSILPLMYLKFENTTPYILIDYLKPFHVELVVENKDLVNIRDKFNQVFYDSEKVFYSNSIYFQLLVIAYNYSNIVNVKQDDNFVITQNRQFNQILDVIKEHYLIKDDFNLIITDPKISLLNISNYFNLYFKSKFYDNYLIQTDSINMVNNPISSDLTITHNALITYTPP